MPNKEIPEIDVWNGLLTISITAKDLKFVTESRGDRRYQVGNSQEFLKELADQLQKSWHSNSTELGITELQYLIDEAVDEIYESGSLSINELDDSHI